MYSDRPATRQGAIQLEPKGTCFSCGPEDDRDCIFGHPHLGKLEQEILLLGSWNHLQWERELLPTLYFSWRVLHKIHQKIEMSNTLTMMRAIPFLSSYCPIGFDDLVQHADWLQETVHPINELD